MTKRMGQSLARLPAPAWLLLAIVLGFGVGALTSSGAPGTIDGFRLIGGLWIDGLRMTILPLVFALVVTGVADLTTGSDPSGRRIGKRLPVVILLALLLAAVVAALLVPGLLAQFPLSPETAAAFRASAPAAAPIASPSLAETLRMLMPVNVVASAAQGAIVPMVIFAVVLGCALGRVEKQRAVPTLGFFRGVADAMIVVVGWVLRAAPFGVFALALVIGATAGLSGAAALGHYILVQVVVALVLTLIPYLLVPVLAGISPARFARALAPAQAVAAGTQSSIATLPAMLTSARQLGIPDQSASVVLSLSVAVFKITSSSGALIFGLSAAWLTGHHIPLGQIVVAIPMSLLATLLVLGIPGPASVITASMPTAIALGAPLEMIPILLAVDTIPDMFRTVANVTGDVAVAAIVAPPLRNPQPGMGGSASGLGQSAGA